MTVHLHGAVVRDIQTLYESGTACGLSDRQLLEQFLSRRDAPGETAFEALLLRHGPMVLRTCRDILREPSDVEDAFQATFLVLVKRARSMGRIESVGGWLYGVACRVAARARSESSRRRAREQRAALRVVEAIDASRADTADFGPIVRDAVRGLPAKYRDVVVLCYWEGLTQEQAATQLCCPLGTVRSRMARARTLLHRRLIRRGLEPAHPSGNLPTGPHAALWSMLGAAPRLSPVPPQLIQATLSAASQVAAGGATAQTLSTLVATLVQDTLGSMTMIKIKMALVGMALVGLTGSTVWLSGLRGQAAPTTQGTDRKQAAPVEKKQSETWMRRVHSLIPGETTILNIVPDGSAVKKGQLVCELDSAVLKDQLVNQQITVRAAEANFQKHKSAREAAEIDVKAYTDGIYLVELREAVGDIKIAEAELALAEDELNTVKSSNSGIKNQIKRAELPVLRARFGLEKAEGRRKLLSDYSMPKKIKELQTAVEQALSAELASKATREFEELKARKIEHQISACVIRAPADGTLTYPKLTGMGIESRIDVGEVVRQRQFLFEIIPAGEGKAEGR
jgi:HlyD family secretion protein